MSIEAALVARIVALGTAAGSRVFREIIEQEPVLPSIAVTRVGGANVERELGTVLPILKRANLRVEVVAGSVSDAIGVTDALRTGLDGWRGTSASTEVLRCVMTNQLEASMIDGDFFLRVIQQDYELTYR